MKIVPTMPERRDDLVALSSRPGPRGGMRHVPAYGCVDEWTRIDERQRVRAS